MPKTKKQAKTGAQYVREHRERERILDAIMQDVQIDWVKKADGNISLEVRYSEQTGAILEQLAQSQGKDAETMLGQMVERAVKAHGGKMIRKS